MFSGLHPNTIVSWERALNKERLNMSFELEMQNTIWFISKVRLLSNIPFFSALSEKVAKYSLKEGMYKVRKC